MPFAKSFYYYYHYYYYIIIIIIINIIIIIIIIIHITESKFHISYLRNQDSTLMCSIIFTCYFFQPSSISFLWVGNTFSISSPFDVTKSQKIALMSHRLRAFHSQCKWTPIFLFLTKPTAMRTQLRFKRHRGSRIHLSVPENYETLVLTLIN